jgi:hypothetical protein
VDNQLAAYPAFNKAAQPAGEGETATTASKSLSISAVNPPNISCSLATDQCGITSGPTGVFNFEGMVGAGYLTTNGTAASNLVYRFDNCSKTVSSLLAAHSYASHRQSIQPYVYDPSTNVEISYDDATSFGPFISSDFNSNVSDIHLQLTRAPSLTRKVFSDSPCGTLSVTIRISSSISDGMAIQDC